MTNPAVLALLIGVFFIIFFIWMILWWAGVQAKRDKDLLRRQRRRRSIRRQELGLLGWQEEAGVREGRESSRSSVGRRRERRRDSGEPHSQAVPETPLPTVDLAAPTSPMPTHHRENPSLEEELPQEVLERHFEEGLDDESAGQFDFIDGNGRNDQSIAFEETSPHGAYPYPPFLNSHAPNLQPMDPVVLAITDYQMTPLTLSRPAPIHITSIQRPNHKLPVFRYMVRTFSNKTDLEASLGNAVPGEGSPRGTTPCKAGLDGIDPPVVSQPMNTQSEYALQWADGRQSVWNQEHMAEQVVDGKNRGDNRFE